MAQSDDLAPVPNAGNLPQDNAGYPPELLQQLVNVQVQQLQIRNRELDLDFRDRDLQHEQNMAANAYSSAALEAQSKYLELELTHEREVGKTRYRYWLIAGSIATLVGGGLIASCIIYNHTDLLVDVARMVLPPIATGVGGYFAGKQKGKDQKETERDTEE